MSFETPTKRPDSTSQSKSGPHAGTDSYHHGDVPASLLSAVDDIIAERGVAGVSLREAARRIGVSHSAPAHHFGDKRGMLTAFATEGFRRLIKEMEAALAATEGEKPDVRLKAVGLGYVRCAIDNPAHFEVMFRHDLCTTDDPELGAAGARAYGILTDTVLEWQECGWIDGSDVERFTTLAWSAVHGFAKLWIEGQTPPDEDPEKAIARALDLFNSAFLARAEL